MSQQDLERRLRHHYRTTVVDAELVPGDLWDDVLSIPDEMPHRRGMVQGRGFVVLVAAALLATLLIGGAIAIGAGILRLPWLSDRDAPLIAGVLEEMPIGDDLTPGTYALGYDTIGDEEVSSSLSMAFTVPGNWKRVRVDGLLWNDGGASILFAIVDNLYVDVCNWDGGLREPPVGPSVDDLAAALVATPGWQDAVVTDVSLSGFSGKHVELTGGEDTSCPTVEPRLFRTLGSPRFALPPGPDEHYEAWILDVDGTRLVILAGREARTTAQVRAEVDAIIESLVISP